MIYRIPCARGTALVLTTLFLFFSLALGRGLAQDDIVDSKGREFWVCFMDNLGSTPGQRPYLYLYLASERPTSATITYMRTGQSITVPIPVANQPQQVAIHTMFGADAVLTSEFGNVGERSRKSFYVTAEDDITLYGVNILSKSSDAFMTFPADMLGQRYVVLSYPNGNSFGVIDTPSEFAVIATEDDTRVQIQSPDAEVGGRIMNRMFEVVLDRGEVFFGQAAVNVIQDVTGTQISTSRPVAVYGGHKRVSIPLSVGNYRDHLVEQMPPLDVWGTNAILTPHFEISSRSLFKDESLARIMAAFDSTEVTLTRAGGNTTFLLNRGEVREVKLTEPVYVQASRSILVAQYEHSVGNVGFGSPEQGDPFMMMVPATNQFFNSYTFQSVAHSEFWTHYINVVIPAAGIGSLRLDGNQVNAAFQDVPGTQYKYAQIRVNAGAHRIEADSAFGLYAYGFGESVSYGYAGGLLFKRTVVDVDQPEAEQTWLCESGEGMISDSRLTDTGIDSIKLRTDTKNVVMIVPPFEQGDDSVAYTARLIDPYQDGFLAFTVKDVGGSRRDVAYAVPGFTLRAAGAPVDGSPLRTDSVLVYNNEESCVSIDIENYGAFERTISQLSFTDKTAMANVTVTPASVTVPPGEKRQVQVCFIGLGDTVLNLQLTGADSCTERDLALFTFIARVDTLAPELSVQCGDDPRIQLVDAGLGSQIAEVRVDTVINGEVIAMPGTQDLPAAEAMVELRRIDRYQDLVYNIFYRDIAGNEVFRSDTVPGFTLMARDTLGDTLGLRTGKEWDVGNLVSSFAVCDTLIVRNYGRYPMVLTNGTMLLNRAYSVPQSQFPMVISPGDSVGVQLCRVGELFEVDRDTLALVDECGRTELIYLRSKAHPRDAEGLDACSNAIGLQTYGSAKRNFMTVPQPNPAFGHAALLDIGLKQEEVVTLELVDMNGEIRHRILMNYPLEAGLHRVEFGLEQLKNGAYFCRLRTAKGEMMVQKMIIGR